jgi:hypothetical protein
MVPHAEDTGMNRSNGKHDPAQLSMRCAATTRVA